MSSKKINNRNKNAKKVPIEKDATRKYNVAIYQSEIEQYYLPTIFGSTVLVLSLADSLTLCPSSKISSICLRGFAFPEVGAAGGSLETPDPELCR